MLKCFYKAISCHFYYSDIVESDDIVLNRSRNEVMTDINVFQL